MATCTTTGAGAWDDAGKWSTVPASDSDVIVIGHAMTGANRTCARMIINAGSVAAVSGFNVIGRIIVNNTGSVNLAAIDLSIGDILIKAGGTFVNTSGILTLTAGDINNGGTFTHSGGKIVYSGSGMLLNATVNDLTINAGVNLKILSSGVAIEGTILNLGTVDWLRNGLTFTSTATSVNFVRHVFGISTAFTIEIWYYCHTLTSASGMFGFFGQINAGSWMHHQGLSATGQITSYFYGPAKQLASVGVLRANAWNHIVISYLSGGNFILYLDGEYDSQIAGSGAITAPNWDIHLGRAYIDRDLNGVISIFRVYNRQLSAAETLEHYRGIYTDETGITGKFEFINQEGTIVKNQASSTDGILIGCPKVYSTITAGNIRNNGSLVIGQGSKIRAGASGKVWDGSGEETWNNVQIDGFTINKEFKLPHNKQHSIILQNCICNQPIPQAMECIRCLLRRGRQRIKCKMKPRYKA